MKVLILSECYYPHGGGAELATHLYAKLLVQEGARVSVVTNRFKEEKKSEVVDGVDIYRLPMLLSSSRKYSALALGLAVFSSIKRLMKTSDVIYVPRYWFTVLLKSYDSEFFAKPVVVHLHDYIPVCPLANLYRFKDGICCNGGFFETLMCVLCYERAQRRKLVSSLLSSVLNASIGYYPKWVMKYVDAVICVSKAQRRLILKRLPAVSRKTHVIYNPLPSLPLLPLNSSGSTGVGYFGGHHPLKGFHILVNAVKNCVNRGVKLSVYASGLTGTRYERIVNGPELREVFKLFKWLNRSEMNKVFGNTIAVVVPSLLPEPLPYIVTESMLRGRIVLASRVGGIPEQTENCPGTFLFEIGDSMGLARHIESIVSLGKNELEELGFRNHEEVKRKFDNHAIVKALLRIFERVM